MKKIFPLLFVLITVIACSISFPTDSFDDKTATQVAISITATALDQLIKQKDYNTTLLIHSDNNNNDTTFKDSSNYKHDITTIGNTTHKEIYKKFDPLIEEAIQSMGQVKEIYSTSQEGLSFVFVDIKDTIKSKHIPQVWDELRRKVVVPNVFFPKQKLIHFFVAHREK